MQTRRPVSGETAGFMSQPSAAAKPGSARVGKVGVTSIGRVGACTEAGEVLADHGFTRPTASLVRNDQGRVDCGHQGAGVMVVHERRDLGARAH